MRRILLATILAGLTMGVAAAQAPYAGLQARSLKALSEQQIADLRAGRGMGLALAAELNGYPGPSHALELADKLALSADQRERLKTLFDEMKAEAIPLGERIIAGEAELDRKFSERTITPVALDSLTMDIGRLQGALRAAHLKYHLATLDALSAEQTRRYMELRGYAGHGGARHHGAH